MGIKIGKMASCKFMTIIVFNIIPTFSNQQNINSFLLYRFGYYLINELQDSERLQKRR